MGKVLDPTKIAEKHIKRATSPDTAEFYKDAMASLDVNPAQLSAEKEDKWFAALEEVHKKGVRKDIMSRIKKEDIVGPAVEFGGENLRKGIENRRAKIEKFWTNWTPILRDIKAQAAKDPDRTPEERAQKMLKNLERLKAAKGKWRK